MNISNDEYVVRVGVVDYLDRLTEVPEVADGLVIVGLPGFRVGNTSNCTPFLLPCGVSRDWSISP